MTPLYKYLPSIHVPAVLDHGHLLFRNLTYFRQQEGMVRGDPYEGIHKDHPGKDVLLQNITAGFRTIDKYSFLHSTNSDLIYAFCLSRRMGKDLMAEFGCDGCIEFFEPSEFIRRVRFALARLISVHRVGLIAKPVQYYDPATRPSFDVTDPTQIAFGKNRTYSHQEEFRLSFGTRQAFKLVQQIAQPDHDPYYDALQGTCRERLVRVGPLRDIARSVIV